MKKVVKKKITKTLTINDLAVSISNLASQTTSQLASVTVELKKYIDTKLEETNGEIESLKRYVDNKAKEVKVHVEEEMLSIREYINNENISLLASTQGQFSMIQMGLEKIKLDLQNLTTRVNQLQAA